MTNTEKLDAVRVKIMTFDKLPTASTARSRNKSDRLHANARMIFHEADNLEGYAVQDDVQYLFEAALQVAEKLIDAAIKARSES
jgi:hypothetical protein